MTKPNGIVLFEGKSKLDGQPIVAIATLKTSNRKTGNMIQTWILRSDISPVEASKALLDGSVCGACPHRQSLGGGCYVNIGQAPNAVYKTYKRGSYPRFDPSVHAKYLKDRKVRLGAYGDPAAVPVSIWANLVQYGNGHTGYTHQAKHRAFDPAILDLCMVSADTPKQALAQHKAGKRTFRVKTSDAPMLPNEIECLADSKGLACADCGLCDGAKNDSASIVINVHGSLSKRYETKYSKANLIDTVSL